MKMNAATLSFFLSAMLGMCLLTGAQTVAGQDLVSGSTAIGSDGISVPGNAPDSSAYADGVRAINDGRWSDAIAIFTRISDQGGDHAEGALYWMAYAENKQGQGSQALDTCGKLRREHQGSNWIDECGALEIEIHARSGQPVHPNAEQSDNLKLLALASLMQHDEKRALAQIQEILDSDSSEKLKQGALFIMGEHHSDTIYPQIARISYVEGDVRISRGAEKGRGKNSTWEDAVADLPLESGFSLVTGAGRAEIEFEDASTLYLGENSVLTFNDLYTTGGIPHTEVALLAGTVTLHIQPYVAGETFLLRTPTDNLLTKYPAATNLRVSSYADGIAIASFDPGVLGLYGAGQQSMIPGQTLYFKDGRRILDAGPTHPQDFSAWDAWVASRFSQRSAAMSQVLKASGLEAPIPGLSDLQGKGRFFSCEPYGTCWEPTATQNAQAAEPAPPAPATEQGNRIAPAQSEPAPGQAPQSGRNIRFVGPPAASGPPVQYASSQVDFPCVPGDVRYMLAGNMLPGGMQGAYSTARFFGDPWAWAVCNSGSWIYRGNRYVWVVGRRHHYPPVRWVRLGHTVAFVPIHPRDVKDRLPVNRKNEVFAVNKKERSIQRIEVPPNLPVARLKEPPREFRAEYLPPLARATEPKMETRQIRDVAVARGGPVRAPGIPITFDHRSQSFMMQRMEMHGTRSVAVTVPIDNHSGNLQGRSGGFSGGGFHGAAASSGGSRYGGGIAASSGGSRSSAGGASSSAASPSAGSVNSSVSSGGGSPHK